MKSAGDLSHATTQDDTPIELDDSSDDEVKEVAHPADAVAADGRGPRTRGAAAAAETGAGAAASGPWWMSSSQRPGVQTRRAARRPSEPSTLEKYKVQSPRSPTTVDGCSMKRLSQHPSDCALLQLH